MQATLPASYIVHTYVHTYYYSYKTNKGSEQQMHSVATNRETEWSTYVCIMYIRTYVCMYACMTTHTAHQPLLSVVAPSHASIATEHPIQCRTVAKCASGNAGLESERQSLGLCLIIAHIAWTGSPLRLPCSNKVTSCKNILVCCIGM